MSTLALDLGTHTGFALRVDAFSTTISGTWDFSTKRHEDVGMRFVRFREALQRMRVNNGVTKIYFEEVRRHAGTGAAHIYGGFVAMLKSFCVDHGVSYESVPVGEIKKSFTGKGNANKEAMIAEALRRGYEPASDDEADALAILELKCGRAT
jgi:Holliday junction resolvasome RuvABC endonuclease subunit